jgi:spermidine synthase
VTVRQVRIRPIEGPGHLVVRETEGRVELIAGDVVLLSSTSLATEFAFGRLAAALACDSFGHVVVGGLGFGATLRGVLDVAAPEARVTVVEKVDAVVRLVRGPLADLAADTLADSRVRLVRGDVADVIAESSGDIDAILLDVDNGPHWASFRKNARLYQREGLTALRRALAPGGALAVWSGYRADSFLAQLRGAGFTASVVPLEAESGREGVRAYVGRA